MENLVERIVEICKQKNIAVSKVEKDLGFGNGYLNPKKVSSMKTDRLILILDYLGISVEEFFNIGSRKFQTIQTALVQIKKASPEIYADIMNSWTAEQIDSSNETEELSKEEKECLNLFRLLSDDDKKHILRDMRLYISEGKQDVK